jgi:hypothetical protein
MMLVSPWNAGTGRIPGNIGEKAKETAVAVHTQEYPSIHFVSVVECGWVMLRCDGRLAMECGNGPHSG